MLYEVITTTNIQLYIQRALNPAKINSIKVFEEDKRAQVYLRPEEVSLAIGKGGLNIKLASQLTGYELDVYREMEVDDEDVSLDEFADEIEGWILDEIKSIGCDTAKSVLDLSVEDFRITSYNVCYTKLLRVELLSKHFQINSILKKDDQMNLLEALWGCMSEQQKSRFTPCARNHHVRKNSQINGHGSLEEEK